MGHYNYWPATNPAPADVPPHYPCDEPCCADYGPGGTDNRRMWDEKGHLDSRVARMANMTPPQADPLLRSNHDSYRMGAYEETSRGDFD